MSSVLRKWTRSAVLVSAVVWGSVALAQFQDGVVEQGRQAIGRGAYADALRLLGPPAKLGDPEAQNALGVLHKQGWGVEQDDLKALEWFRAAAEQGHAKAEYNLGLMFDEGRGVPRDYPQAVLWYRRSAQQGYPLGQSILGAMYATGNGVEQDYAQAMDWYLKAARQGEPEAQRRVGEMLVEAQGVERDYAEAESWFRKGASQGHFGSQYWLGRLYEEGWGVERDYARAAEWYRSAAEHGVPEAQYRLGVLHARGQGVPHDDGRASGLLEQAAAAGHAEAQEFLDSHWDASSSGKILFDDFGEHFAIELPRGWHVTYQGAPGPYGVVVFSAEEFKTSLKGLDPEAAMAKIQEMHRRVDTGALPSFFVDRMRSKRGMSCAGYTEKATEKLVAALLEGVALGRGSELLEEPRVEAASLGGCQGLKIRLRARTVEGWEMVMLVYSVAVEKVRYDFGLRNSAEYFEKNRPLFESTVTSLRPAPRSRARG